ncbi:CGNR zinc finger domain-containing protein [Actinomadura rugatobispora]|uniref:CGNR zinc finger domain-containing protein n=1 Tax=Actinomadura rugatobispora TaxID=1994 RepID=A0ABW1AD54_9ACTN|nr:CGNR zinc finger domain-containing protein [Actinomadura rugatobispora]
MDLASYADLAIELVNTQDRSGDTLRDLAGLHALLARRPQLAGRVGHRDLDTMRALRAQLRAVFAAAGAGDEEEAIDLLNSLLIQHPVHPQLTRHDDDWHVHLNEGGSVPDRYAARAAMGLAVRVGERGIDRLGVCRAEGCGRVFFDTTAARSRRYCSDRCAGRTGVAAADPPPQPRVTEAVGAGHRAADRPAGNTATRDGGQ